MDSNAIDIAVVLHSQHRLALALEFFSIREGEYSTELTNSTRHLVTDVPSLTYDYCGDTAHLINWSEQ